MKEKKQILLLIDLLEEVYASNDELVWEEILYIIEKLKETITN